MKHASDPDWFYRLTPEKQIAVLAVNRPEQKKKRGTGTKLARKVNASNNDAKSFWLGG